MDTKCRALNQDGSPCQAAHWRDNFCRWHSPELAEQRRAWSAAGGKARSNKARAAKAIPAGLKSMAEVQAMLTITLGGVLSGRIEPGVGTAAANIARAIRDLAGAADLESRIAELERTVAGRNAG